MSADCKSVRLDEQQEREKRLPEYWKRSAETGEGLGTTHERDQTLTQEIPRQQWSDFFEAFSRQHQAWLVTIETIGPDLGSQVNAARRPLAHITAELQEAGNDTISIALAKPSGDSLHIVIPAPRRLWLKKNEVGADEALEIETANGPTTILTVCSPMLPEMVDDVLVWNNKEKEKKRE